MTTQFISKVERELYPFSGDSPGPGNYSSNPATPMLPNFYSFGGAASSSPREVIVIAPGLSWIDDVAYERPHSCSHSLRYFGFLVAKIQSS